MCEISSKSSTLHIILVSLLYKQKFAILSHIVLFLLLFVLTCLIF